MTNIPGNSRLPHAMDKIVRLILLLLVFVMLALSVVQLSEWYPIKYIQEKEDSETKEDIILAVEIRGGSVDLYHENALSGLLLFCAACYCAYRASCLFGLFKTDKWSVYGDFLLVSIFGLISYLVPLAGSFKRFQDRYILYRIKPTAYTFSMLAVFVVLTVFSAVLYFVCRNKRKEEGDE